MSPAAFQAWLAPGARLPLVFGTTTVLFTAGPTTYEFDIVCEDADFRPRCAGFRRVGGDHDRSGDAHPVTEAADRGAR